MSLEKAILDLHAAVEANTAALEKIAAAQGKALKAIETKEADEAEPRTSRRSRDEKADDAEEPAPRRSRDRKADEAEEPAPRRGRREEKADEKEADEPRRSSRRAAADDKPAKKKEPKLADIRAAVTTFIQTDDSQEEEERRDFLDSMYDELGADKLTDIKEEDYQQVLDWLADKKAGKKVNFGA